MATTTHGVATVSTSNTNIYTSASFTPAADDLLVAFINVSDTTDAGAISDSLGGTWTLVTEATRGGLVHKFWAYVRDALSDGSAMTVTIDVTGDNGTGAHIVVERIAGMSRTGSAAIRQSKVQNNGSGGNTPTVTFDAACLTGNVTLGAVANNSNPAGLTPPTNWNELADVGYATPNNGVESVNRDSGFTGTAMTWGSTSATQFGAIIIELDTSAAAAGQPTLSRRSGIVGARLGGTTFGRGW